VLTIRLQRSGRENIPFYRVVLADHHRPVKGKFIEKLGYYNPLAKPWKLEVDTERILEWIKKGAQPSSTMARLLKAQGVKDMEKFIRKMHDRKKKNAPEAVAATGAAPAAAAAPATPPAAPKAA
jgi:small subunit ribosomal protein S16